MGTTPVPIRLAEPEAISVPISPRVSAEDFAEAIAATARTSYALGQQGATGPSSAGDGRGRFNGGARKRQRQSTVGLLLSSSAISAPSAEPSMPYKSATGHTNSTKGTPSNLRKDLAKERSALAREAGGDSSDEEGAHKAARAPPKPDSTATKPVSTAPKPAGAAAKPDSAGTKPNSAAPNRRHSNDHQVQSGYP